MTRTIINGKTRLIRSTAYPPKEDLKIIRNLNDWYIYIDGQVFGEMENLIDQANELLTDEAFNKIKNKQNGD